MSGGSDWPEAPRERPAGSRSGVSGFYGGGRGGEPGHQGGQDRYYADAHFEDAHYDDEDFHDGHYDDGHYDEGWPVVGGAVPAGGGRRGGRRRGHPILTALAVLFVLVLVAGGGFLLWAQGQINPGGHRGPAVTVVIPKGSSTSAIGDRLASAGVIHDGWLFALYVRLHGYGPLYPGTYQMQKNSSYSVAISSLRTGPTVLQENLVIPEGYTLAQIAQKLGALPHMGLSAQKFLAAAQSGTVRSPYEPAGVNNLEGLLFPATYQVRQGETEVDVLEEMVGAFNDRAQSLGLTSAASQLGMTPYQVITVASIVEREAKVAADRPNVASAIYNRLRIGMTLGADSTQTYYLRLTDPTIQPTPSQLDHPSPYNTRTNKGLPPTPIANPGLASLQAAANPPSTHYIYFVEISRDGKLGFASTSAGFDHLRQQCQAAGLC